MVSDVAHSPSQRVSTTVSYAMLDTSVLDDAAAPHHTYGDSILPLFLLRFTQKNQK